MMVAGVYLNSLLNHYFHEKIFFHSPFDDDTCACSECAYMKMNTLEKLYNCLANEKPEIKMNADIINAAQIPIKRMIELS